MQTPSNPDGPRRSSVPPPQRPWAEKARLISRWMLYASGLLILLTYASMAGAAAISISAPRAVQIVLISVGAGGGLVLGILGIAIRFIVLAVGFTQFTLREMLGLIICVAAGGAFFANRIPIAGLILIGGALIYVVSILWAKDNDAER